MLKMSASRVLHTLAAILVLIFCGFAFSAAIPDEGFAATAKINVSKLTVSTIPNQGYTGKALTPKPTVKYNNKKLTVGTDYTLKYASNIKKGIATVTITGKGGYTGSRKTTFKIVARKSISSATVSIGKQGYTGKALTPAPVVKLGNKTLKKGTDYTLKYANNIKRGIATVTITGKNLYNGTKKASFKIVTRTSIAKATLSGLTTKTYTGTALTPKPVVKIGKTTLKEGTHYKLSYKNNVNAGTATITITGKNLYSSTKKVTFKITPASLSNASVSAISTQSYRGSAITPKPTVKVGAKTLVNGTDYVLSYKNNVNMGTASVVITGKGNYSGTKTATFSIEHSDIAKASISTINKQAYTRTPVEPKPVIKLGGNTLTEGVDYALSYENNISCGTASVTATGIGNMYGTVSTTFEIEMPSLEGIKIREDASTGAAQLNVKLADFNKVFSYGDAIDIEFSNGYVIENIPYYNGFYAKLGAPLVLSYLGENDPSITTNYGERIWEIAGLSSEMTATLRLAEKGAYSAVQDALNITYTNNRSDFPTDAAFANFRQVVGGNLNGKLYRSASPINNWRKRAAYASALAESAEIAFILDLSDTADEIQLNIGYNHSGNVDTSYFEELFYAGNVEPLSMNSSYSTAEYQQKVCAGLAVMAHKDGPYLVHCIEGKDRTGFTCLLLEALAGSSYDEMLEDYMQTYANYCFITKDGTPAKYAAVQSVCFDSMIDFLVGEDGGDDYSSAARNYLISGGMSEQDVDLLAEKLTS